MASGFWALMFNWELQNLHEAACWPIDKWGPISYLLIWIRALRSHRYVQIRICFQLFTSAPRSKGPECFKVHAVSDMNTKVSTRVRVWAPVELRSSLDLGEDTIDIALTLWVWWVDRQLLTVAESDGTRLTWGFRYRSRFQLISSIPLGFSSTGCIIGIVLVSRIYF